MPRIQIASEVDRLLLKQANLYRLQAEVDKLATGVGNGARFTLSERLMKQLHGIAMEGLLTTAGQYRAGAVKVGIHTPPPAIEVDAHMAAMCRYVNEQWTQRDLVHLSAFVMWRLNWIHPFENGNGRTSRAISYLVLCAHHGSLLPAKNSVIQQIIGNREPYYKALRACDEAYAAKPEMDYLQPLEQLIGYLLKEQLRSSLP